ncbi:unnamed protein product, partial [Closterium sp. NIES-65]
HAPTTPSPSPSPSPSHCCRSSRGGGGQTEEDGAVGPGDHTSPITPTPATPSPSPGSPQSHTHPAEYLDRTTLLAFTFTSKDSAFGASLEGYAVALDKDVCKAPCGQSVEQPKVVPALPFYYEDDSTHYRDLYNAKLDKCHDTGPDVVFQYTPPQNMVLSHMVSEVLSHMVSEVLSHMVVSVDLCSLTEFDSVLSAYERTKPGAKPMVDGWGGTGGKFAINMVVTKVLKALDAKAPRNKAFQPIRSKAVSANALASLRSMPVPP